MGGEVDDPVALEIRRKREVAGGFGAEGGEHLPASGFGGERLRLLAAPGEGRQIRAEQRIGQHGGGGRGPSPPPGGLPEGPEDRGGRKDTTSCSVSNGNLAAAAGERQGGKRHGEERSLGDHRQPALPLSAQAAERGPDHPEELLGHLLPAGRAGRIGMAQVFVELAGQGFDPAPAGELVRGEGGPGDLPEIAPRLSQE